MLEQLKELLEMQKAYDNAVMAEHGLVYNYEIAEKVKIACLVEVGEFLNELPSKFKYWKKSAKDNREKALEEYVDILHFELSLLNCYESHEDLEDVCKYHEKAKFDKDEELTFSELKSFVDYMDSELGLSFLLTIDGKVGFTWEEIYNAYKRKNKINWERLANGY